MRGKREIEEVNDRAGTEEILTCLLASNIFFF